MNPELKWWPRSYFSWFQPVIDSESKHLWKKEPKHSSGPGSVRRADGKWRKATNKERRPNRIEAKRRARQSQKDRRR